MKNITLFLLLIAMCSCSTTKPDYITRSLEFNIKDELNKSVIDGFFDNDSTKIPNNCDLFIK